MGFQLLLGLAALAAFAGLAALRIQRVRAHRDPVDGWRRIGLIAAFLFVPPLVLQILFAPKTGPGAVDGVGAVLLYVLLTVALWILTWIAALVVARFAPIERRQSLLLALVGRDTSDIVPFDPPMTSEITADVERVDTCNATFPRGTAFLAQASLPGFRVAWEALDSATRQLEARIAEQRRLHLGVAERAIDTAADARGRLDTLRREAMTGGQVWAT